MHDPLVTALSLLTAAVNRATDQIHTQRILDAINLVETRINMKLSEIKTQIANAAARSTEAFNELGTRIAALQQQIDELIAGNTDPEVTDAVFDANLQVVKENIDALADIVPTP